MKYFTIITITLLFCSLHYNVNAQDIECGTKITAESQAYFNSIKQQLNSLEQEFLNGTIQSRSLSALSSIPIKAHIIRTTAGTGGLSVTQLNNAIADMNILYANAEIEFYLCDGINYIDDDNYYSFETNEENALTTANNVTGLINIYFTNSVVSSSSGSGLCGYAYFPGGPETILMNNNCATNSSTLSHEMGHFFSLYHTHGTSNSTLTDELVNGSNCETSGDFICDTPADPKLSYGNVTPACIYTGTEIDSNGDTFVPDPNNIMSYSRKTCRTVFSPLQYARIYASYQISRNNLSCPSLNVDLTTNFTRDCGDVLQVDFVDNSVGATSWQWDVNGDDIIDYTTQNPSHTYSPGLYNVTLTISDGSDTITKVFQNLIDFETQSILTAQLFLTLNTDDWSQEISWELKDSNDMVLYSFGPYNGTTDDFSTFNYTFDVDPSECYSFSMIDGYGDGICCASGNGNYELKTDGDFVIASGGNYGFGETTYMANESLSINEFNTQNVSVYPNPVNDNVLNVQVQNYNTDLDFEIINLLGQQITKGTLLNKQVDVSNLTSGTYFLILNSEDNKVIKKFIKL